LSPVVAFAPQTSALLQTLLDVLPLLHEKLARPDEWKGFCVTSGDEPSYRRAVCRDDLVVGSSRFIVGAHLFERADEVLHDHRWPLAVLPLAVDGSVGTALYEQRWQAAAGTPSGHALVHSGQAWAMERAEDRHALTSLGPHASINLTDVTGPPLRENRLTVAALSAPDTERVCRVVEASLRRWLTLRELELLTH
jgi:hypothetical protein